MDAIAARPPVVPERVTEAPSVPLPAPPISVPARPLFAAATAFENSVEDVAATQVKASRTYQHQLSEIRQVAARIYRDPDQALTRIEATLLKVRDAEKVSAALSADPAKAGELRGSERLLDGLKARQERQDALGQVGALGSETRKLGRSYEAALPRAVEDETRRRQRMGVEVPDLSPAARAALVEIERTRREAGQAFRAAVESVLSRPEVLREILRTAEALDRRFGADAVGNRAQSLDALVPPAERARLAEVRPVLATAQWVRGEHQKAAAPAQQKSQATQLSQ